nr:hypothetical protein [Fredinandcohnia onubensis]
MELFSAEFFSALLSIIVIDLVLAGDNAIVIGLAARNLPKEQQKKAIIWGTVGAIFIRAAATLIMVWGCTLFIKLIDRFPIIVTIGAAILSYTAAKMIVGEPFLHEFFENPWFRYSFEALTVIAVVFIGTKAKKTKAQSIKEIQKAS